MSEVLEEQRLTQGESSGPEVVHIPIETQLSVLQVEVGNKRGTAIAGVGGCMRRPPKKRGVTRACAPNLHINERLQAAQEEARSAREIAAASVDRVRQLEEEREKDREEMRVMAERMNRFFAQQQLDIG